MTHSGIVFILGSGPNAVDAKRVLRRHFDTLVVINNAWSVRSDWDVLIHPEDFPSDRRPSTVSEMQSRVSAECYVPVINRFGGMIYAGGTMAFTAGYWALGALQPRVMAYLGCDMVYPASGKTHFYGTGTPDPLRDDPTLQSLEAKSARLALVAARHGCLCVNLSEDPSRLVFPRADASGLSDLARCQLASVPHSKADALESALDLRAPDGRYWEAPDVIRPSALRDIDRLWLEEWDRYRLGLPVDP